MHDDDDAEGISTPGADGPSAAEVPLQGVQRGEGEPNSANHYRGGAEERERERVVSLVSPAGRGP